MGGKKLLSRRTRRYIGAAIAAGVTSFIAMNTINKASAQDCGLQDAMDWQLALHDQQIEQSPEHISAVTEAFLDTCPDRPEFYDASRIAGIAAADLGEAKRAASHFANAGPMTDRLSNFYAISTFLAAGETKAAWRQRDQFIEAWRTRLERHPHVSVHAEPTEDGMIYQLYFSQVDEDTGIQAAWVAVPFGAGWPATLTFARDPMRMAFRRARTGQDVADMRYVDLHRCFARRSLGQITTKLTRSEFDAAAQASLAAYLARPDRGHGHPGSQIDICYSPARLLPGVPKLAD
ncbi:MAG: hypothetical protein ACE37M_09690 [Henriciella sp.]